MRLSLNLLVAHDDSAAEFAVFGKFLAFVADVAPVSVGFFRAVNRVADALDAGEHPKVLVDWKAGQADYVLSLCRCSVSLPSSFFFAGQDPCAIEHVRVSLELLGGIVAVIFRAAADLRPADFLIGEVKQIIKHNIVTRASSIDASALVAQGFESGYRYKSWIIRESY